MRGGRDSRGYLNRPSGASSFFIGLPRTLAGGLDESRTGTRLSSCGIVGSINVGSLESIGAPVAEAHICDCDRKLGEQLQLGDGQSTTLHCDVDRKRSFGSSIRCGADLWECKRFRGASSTLAGAAL